MIRLHKGELVVVVSTPEIPQDLRGKIGELMSDIGPQRDVAGNPMWGYLLRVGEKQWCALRRALLPLPPPGDPSRNDENYDGYKLGSWSALIGIWQPPPGGSR